MYVEKRGIIVDIVEKFHNIYKDIPHYLLYGSRFRRFFNMIHDPIYEPTSHHTFF